MAKQGDKSNSNLVWYCVLDRHCRLLYLGTDQAAALQFTGTDLTLKSASRMGDALTTAAKAVGISSQGPR